MFLWRFARRVSLSGVFGGNYEILGGDKKEEILLTYNSDINGEVQG